MNNLVDPFKIINVPVGLDLNSCWKNALDLSRFSELLVGPSFACTLKREERLPRPPEKSEGCDHRRVLKEGGNVSNSCGTQSMGKDEENPELGLERVCFCRG